MKKIIIIFILLLFCIYINLGTKIEALESDVEVDIKGAINNPGIYHVTADARVYDVIGLAGGLKSYADTSLINLSKKVSDQDVIIIYTIDEVATLTNGDTAIKVVEKECICPKINNIACINKIEESNKININTASIEELQKLSGIGKSKAQKIIEYRNSKLFTTIEDIMNIKGIGKGIFDKIKDNIRV